MDSKVKEGGRVLRSKGSEAILKDQIQVPQLKCESLGQKTSTPKKLPKKKKFSESRGKENEPPSGAKEIQDQEVKRGVNQGIWKRIQQDGDEATSYTAAVPETGLKRKGTMPLKEVQDKTESGKWSKKEEEVVVVGQLMAKHLGSAEATAQPHRYQ